MSHAYLESGRLPVFSHRVVRECVCVKSVKE